MLIHKETIVSISGKWKLKADACIVWYWRVLPTPVVSNQKVIQSIGFNKCVLNAVFYQWYKHNVHHQPRRWRNG